MQAPGPARKRGSEDIEVTSVEICLPNQLAQEARTAGLLTPEVLKKWLREQLRAQRTEQLFSAMDRMAAVDQPDVMSPESVASELAAMRAERRAHSSL